MLLYHNHTSFMSQDDAACACAITIGGNFGDMKSTRNRISLFVRDNTQEYNKYIRTIRGTITQDSQENRKNFMSK